MTNKIKNLIYNKSWAFDSVTIIFCLIATLMILRQILKYSHYGIDFTDEGLYTVWIANPFQYKWSISQFGFIYHPIYILLDGNLAAIRQANILITYSLSSGFIYTLAKNSTIELKNQNIQIAVLATGLSVTSLMIFESWLITPNYNSLSLQSLLISSIGLILADKSFRKKSVFGWILLGTGHWLTFMAKPTTALALFIGAIIYLISSRKFSLRLALLSTACCTFLFISSALVIDGSLYQFYDRLRTSAELASYLDGGHSLSRIIRLDKFKLNENDNLAIILAGSIGLIITLISYQKNDKTQITSAIFSAFFLGIVIYFSLGLHNYPLGFSEFRGLIFWSITFASIITSAIILRFGIIKSFRVSDWALAVLFLLMPYIYAFGTNGNYWRVQCSASIFWLSIAVIFLRPLAQKNKSWAFCLPLVLLSLTISAALLQTGLEHPYRQPQPLRINSTVVEFGASGSKLILSQEYAKYLMESKDKAEAAGLLKSTPVIDLTGQSPALLYALGAENLGQAWMIGGYPGSLKLASAALTAVGCEKLSSAWLLVEPNGPRFISNDLLISFGADININYAEASSWYTAKGSGGYPDARKQILYRPVNQTELLNACRSLRQR